MIRVWMINDVGGYIDINAMYLYIRFTHSRYKCYRIEAEVLYKMLNTDTNEFVLDNLTFIPMRYGEGEKVIRILDENSKSDKDQAVVSKKELTEALYYWIG